MAVFHAFRALRPTPEKAADVAALPYDVVNREEAKSIGDENPLSFLHIDRPEMDLEPETDLYDDRVYEKAKEKRTEQEVMSSPLSACSVSVIKAASCHYRSQIFQ